MLTVPVSILLSILSFLVGWVMFAYNTDSGCDPLAAGYISNPNQVEGYYEFKLEKMAYVSFFYIW